MIIKKRKINFWIVVLLLMISGKSYGQFYSIKTDILGLVTGTFNVEGSVVVNKRWSLHLPMQYNPWTFSNNRKFKNLTVLPGARYWFTESYGRSYFMGVNGIISRYNINLWGSDNRYDGMAYGLGLSGGYTLPIGVRWNIEFELGAGAAWTRYDKYPCTRCGRKLETKNSIRFVPDKVAVSLVYLF